MKLLESHYCATLERIQKLHSNTPKAVVYLLAGSLPLEGIIHSRQLSLFSMVCRLKTDLLHQHGRYVLTVLNSSCKSWFFQIQNICLQYNLPHPLALLQSDMTKEKFKSLVKRQVRKYWTDRFSQDTFDGKLKSLKYFHVSSCQIGKPHYLWVFSKTHPFESAKAVVIARMMSGRYRTDMLERHWSHNKNGYCLAPTCVNVQGDLTHMFVTCPAICNVRKQMYTFWLQKSVGCQPLVSLLVGVYELPPEDFIQFIISPIIFYQVRTLCQLYGSGLFGHVLYLTRTYAFHVDRVNRQLRGRCGGLMD